MAPRDHEFPDAWFDPAVGPSRHTDRDDPVEAGPWAMATPWRSRPEAAALHDAVAAAAELPSAALGTRALGEWLCDLHLLRSRVDALISAVSTDAAAARVQSVDELSSLREFVAAHTNIDPSSIAADLTVGTWLCDFGDFAAAATAGILSRQHLLALRRVDNPRSHRALVDAQATLIRLARDGGWREFTVGLGYWIHRNDPDGCTCDDHVAARRFTLTKQADGSVKGTLHLEPVGGDLAIRAIDHQAEKLRQLDLASGTLRTPAQRRADALIQLLVKGSLRQDGTLPFPLVHLVMSQAVVEDALARAAECDEATPAGFDPDHLPVHPHDLDRRCELVDGTPIHPRVGLAVVSIANLRRLVLGANGEVLDLGTSTRLFPPQLRHALLAAARGRCAVPGCHAPTSWLQADHVLPWIHHGPTATDNAQMLCGPHNRRKADRPPPPAPGPEP